MSSSHGTASNTGNKSAIKVEESSGDEKGEGMTLGDAISVNQVKDTSLASLEELQNLAGGADIKVLNCL